MAFRAPIQLTFSNSLHQPEAMMPFLTLFCRKASLGRITATCVLFHTLDAKIMASRNDRARFMLDHQRRIFRDAVQRSGVRRRINPQDIRRAAATHLHLSGMPLKRLQAILGHSSLEMTQPYILEDEAQINGSHSPFDQLNGLQ